MSKEKQAQQNQKKASQPEVSHHEAMPQKETVSANASVVQLHQLSHLSQHPTSQSLQQTAILRMQQQQGNMAVQRFLFNKSRPSIQRDNGDDTPGSDAETDETQEGAQEEMEERTVPIPQEQRAQLENPPEASSETAPAAENQPAGGEQAEEPPVPEEATVRIPVRLNFELLPPELQIQILESLNITATVTQAQIQWRNQQLRLSLGYNYGGDITAGANVDTGGGTLSAGLGYDPGSNVGRANLGYRTGQWRVGMQGNTQGRFGASLSYGAALPPMPGPLTESMMAGEAGARNLMGAVPGILDDPATLPGAISEHGDDIDAVSDAVSNLRRVIDLRQQDPSRINWGFYLRFAASPDSGVNVTTGVGGTF